MIIELIALIITGATAYYGYHHLIADKLDSPRNSEAVKGLEKEEIKAKIKEDEAKIKTTKAEIKTLETERKGLLKDDTKKEEAQAKLEEKEAKQKELQELEVNLKDLKVVEKGGWKAYTPNKLTMNNGLWVGGSLLGLVLIYKVCIGIFRSVFPNLGWGE